MYKVQYNKAVILSLKLFIDSYKDSFIKLIKWWWLDFENEIIQNYISIWNKLYENIKNNIDTKLESETVFGRIVEKECVIIDINNFKLFVYYKEMVKLNERNVYKLEFHKK